MTKEERNDAIEFFKKVAEKECNDAKYSKLAIEALEQKPSNDIVSCGVFEQAMWERDVAITQLKELGYGLGEKPKTGHWISGAIQGEIDGQIVKAFICSECGAISVFRMTGGKIVNGDLCPNCGAKMVDPQEGSEE